MQSRTDEETCTATCKDGSPCNAYPVRGEDKCRMHLGTSEDGTSHENNDHAASHELYSQSNTYYQRRDDAGQALIDAVYADYREQYVSLHGEPPTGDDAMLFKIAVNIHKQLKADEWARIKPDSLDSGHPLVDRSEQRTPQGECYYEYVVTAVDKAEHRLATRTRQWLKDMGLNAGDGDDTTVNVNVHEEILEGMKAAHQD